MAVFRLALFDAPANELERLRADPVPRWALRLYWSYGLDADRAPLSASVEALGEGLGRRLEEVALALRKMEARGWHVAVDGAALVVASDAPRTATIAALDEDGIWTVVREHAVRDAEGEIAWR